MSVINKMLKDLEDRQQPESSLESGAGQSVIIERGGSKSSPLLLILLLMILILLGVISWQMLSQGTQQVVVQPKAQAPVSVPQHQSTQSKEPIGSQLVVQTGEQDANQET